ncbi:hypothetical protein PLESTB_000665900 [Pleodorina starrii]|uniref:OCRE domain-containing protein n=1 Tax=Pleodorina starrii TaxID=330485 RepID=A0A9W6F1D2_9CHLO|nr:hypothetical protein PLESTB_000665900 [Pleodorina starrii]GLC65888.1 hypothetical protein PLESTF_000354700 [Pleodorina starrii]
MKFPSVEIEKRDRDEHTDSLIKSLLDEEKASKKQKRGPPQSDVGAKPAVPQARKGKTLAEIEAEEGGPIKESLVGMAQTKRALDRKKRDVELGDTDVVTNTERYEKDTLEVEQEDGITFEPFNLKQEREEGYFDEDGNYVLRKQGGEEGDDEKDAWLTSEEAKVVSDEVRRKIEAQRALAEEAARRGPLTERQIAQRKADMAAMMRPGETVTRALKRLGGGAAPGAAAGGSAAAGLPHRAMGKRERARLLAQQQQQQQQADPAAASASGSGADADAREQFTRMTELADELLGEGELEIYSANQEELLRSARMWLPQLAAPPPPKAAAAAAHAAAGDDDDDDMFSDKDMGGAAAKPAAAAAAVDDDQDMFADEDEGGGAAAAATTAGTSGRTDGGGSAQPGGHSGGAAAVGAAAPSGPGPAATAGAVGATAATAGGDGGGSSGGDAVDYGSWPIKELKRLLQERGVDSSGFVEKADLVAKVRQVVDAAPTAGAAAPGAGSAGGGGGGSDGAFVAPPGYVFDPSSGYFFSEDSGMYYDTSSGGYCQAATGKWFYLDASCGSFVEWKQGGQ